MLLLARRSLFIERERKRSSWYTVVAYVCVSAGQKVYCSKTADWIRMPFRVVSGVGRGMSVLDGVEIVEEEGAVLGVNMGIPL